MQILALVFAFALTASGTPVNTSPNTPGKVVAGYLSHLAALPLFGPLWLNGAISGNRPTNLNSTPIGYIPVSIAAGQEVWHSKSTESMSISYVKDDRITSATQTRVGLWADRNNLPDLKVSAIEVDVSNAPAVPADVTSFTRTFTCRTGDRIYPSSLSYLFIKTRGEVKADILSDRITTIDNRNTARLAGSFYTIECTFVSDQYGYILPPRKESIAYSDPLPLPEVVPQTPPASNGVNGTVPVNQ